MLTPTEDYYRRKWFDDNESTLLHNEYLQERDTLNKYAEYDAVYKQTNKLFKIIRQHDYDKSELDYGFSNMRELHKALHPNGYIDYSGILHKLYYGMMIYNEECKVKMYKRNIITS